MATFRTVYQKRFNGPRAYVYCSNFPSIVAIDFVEWLQKQRVHKAFITDNYERLESKLFLGQIFQDEKCLTVEIDWLLYERKKVKDCSNYTLFGK